MKFVIEKNSSNNNCKIKEIAIAYFINSLRKFTKTLHNTPKNFSMRRAIFLATLAFFAKLFLFPNWDPVFTVRLIVWSFN